MKQDPTQDSGGASNGAVSNDDWRAAFAAFDRYLACSDAERSGLLARLGAEQPRIAGLVDQLRQNHQRPATLLDSPVLDKIGKSPDSPSTGFHPPSSKPSSFGRVVPASLFSWGFLVCSAIGFFFYCFCIHLLLTYGSHQLQRDWTGDWDGSRLTVIDVDPAGLAAGKILPGDRVIAIDGKSDKETLALYTFQVAPRASTSHLQLLRKEKRLDVLVPRRVVVSARRMADNLTFLFVSMCFYITAVLIGFLRPDRRVTRLAAAALLSEAIVLLTLIADGYLCLATPLEALLIPLMGLPSGVHFAIALHFYAIFFDEAQGVNRRHIAVPLLYVWGVANAISDQVLMGSVNLPFLFEHLNTLLTLFWVSVSFFAIAPTFICVFVVRGYWKARATPDGLRAKWIALGSLMGIVPYVLYRTGLAIAVWADLSITPSLDYGGLRAVILASVAVPACTAYAVVKHQVFDIRVVIRRTLRYMMLRGVLETLLLLQLLAVLLTLKNNAHRTLSEALWHNVEFMLPVGMLIATLAARGRVLAWLAKHYYRDTDSRDPRFQELTQRIRKSASIPLLAEAAAQRISPVFHPSQILVLLEDDADGSFRSMYVSSKLLETVWPASSLAAAWLRMQTHPKCLGCGEAMLPGDPDLDRLTTLDMDLMIPLVSSSQATLGAIFLGSKGSEQRYFEADLQLLAHIADDVAARYESLSLQRHLEQQQARSGLIEKQISIAGRCTLLECPVCGLLYDFPTTECAADGTTLRLTYAISRVIAGRYQLTQRVGRGGMGTVYRGWDRNLQRTVAVKLIAPPVGGDVGRWTERAKREATALAQLKHRNVVVAHDFGTEETGVAYLVMEFVDGETLRGVLDKGPLAPNVAAQWFDQILDGVSAAHNAGIIHRDLKPANILIANPFCGHSSEVKILDFGIARLSTGEENANDMTFAGARIGTAPYMSPEQANGAAIDERTDIFSVGVMIVEALAGHLTPPRFASPDSLSTWLAAGGALSATTESDRMLMKILEECLAPQPHLRSHSAAALRRRIVPLISSYSGTLQSRANATS